MPTDPSKQPQQITTIPPGAGGAQLVELVNDRLEQINLAFAKFLQNPALGNADLGQAKLINVADPKDDLDGVNLRTLKRAIGSPVEQQVTGQGGGIEQPTIYFTFDGLPFDGEESPYAIILPNRDSFQPTRVGLSAVGPPTSESTKINLSISGIAGDMLTSDLELPIGQEGVVSTSAFRLSAAFRTGYKIQATITRAGGATQVTIALALRGH